MSDESDRSINNGSTDQSNEKCAECGRTVSAEEAIRSEEGVLCQSCYQQLRQAVQAMIDKQSEDINYLGAVGGGLLGGILGALVWWGFTALTHIALGLVAILIGFAVGKGVVILSGNKRAVSLQVISVIISVACFAVASYWVNRTFLLKAAQEQGLQFVLPILPDPALLMEVIRLDFGIWDVLFLAIVVWQSWKMPKPISLA